MRSIAERISSANPIARIVATAAAGALVVGVWVALATNAVPTVLAYVEQVVTRAL